MPSSSHHSSQPESLPLPIAEPFAVVNLGCKVNRVESDTITARLRELGGHPANIHEARLVIVNSCTVTGEADKKTRKAVRAALRANQDATIVVTGCGVAVDAQTYREIDPRVITIERTDLFIALEDQCARTETEQSLRIGGGFHTRVNIKAQDGCDHACTYCIVHVARGPAKSAPFNDVVNEAAQYFSRGVKEVVLAGIDLGSYRFAGRQLCDLVLALIEQADKSCAGGELPARVRISSIEPQSIDDRLIDVLSTAEGRVCRHLHLPLQSGSTRVLREMARPYRAQDFFELVQRLYESVPSLSLTSDIICGFPGETEEDFAETLEMARRCRFSKIHVFPYSRREGTPAAARSDQIDPQVKSSRAERLRVLSDELRAKDLFNRIGTTELALVEPACALTESYHEVAVPADAVEGALVPITIAADSCSS